MLIKETANTEHLTKQKIHIMNKAKEPKSNSEPFFLQRHCIGWMFLTCDPLLNSTLSFLFFPNFLWILTMTWNKVCKKLHDKTSNFQRNNKNILSFLIIERISVTLTWCISSIINGTENKCSLKSNTAGSIDIVNMAAS